MDLTGFFPHNHHNSVSKYFPVFSLFCSVKILFHKLTIFAIFSWHYIIQGFNKPWGINFKVLFIIQLFFSFYEMDCDTITVNNSGHQLMSKSTEVYTFCICNYQILFLVNSFNWPSLPGYGTLSLRSLQPFLVILIKFTIDLNVLKMC